VPATLDVRADVDTSDLLALCEHLIAAVSHTDAFWDDLAAWWHARQTDWMTVSRLAPNAASTLARKGDKPPLVDTGALRESARTNQPFNINAGLDGSATFGLRKGTPSYLKGVLARSGARGAPKRPPVNPFDAVDSVEVGLILTTWFEEILHGA
jgi:hypothetical protein